MTLVQAVRQQDTAAIAALIGRRGEVALRSAEGETALQWAAHWGDEALVRRLIRLGADVNARDRYGVTPLLEAAANQSGQVSSMLLHAGADPNSSYGAGQTALMSAALNGNVPAVTALLAAGANVNARDALRGQTALMWAAARGHERIVHLLLAHGASVDLADLPVDRHLGRVNQAGGGPSTLPAGGMTALLFAARNGQAAVVRTLLDAGADIDQSEGDGWTPLLLAIVNTHFSVAELLVNRGADLTRADHAGLVPLFAAVEMRFPDITARPLRAQTDPVSSEQLLEFLLAKGADPNIRLRGPIGPGETPFMRAVRSGDLVAMRILLAHGAKPTLTTDDGATAIMVAAGIERSFGAKAQLSSAADLSSAIAWCQKLGIDINAANRNGDTALHAAAANADVDMVRLLLGKGARTDVRDARNLTPLDLAEGKGARRPGMAFRPEVVAQLKALLAKS